MKEKLQYHYLELIQKLFIYFLLYACIGWIYEVFLEVVVYQWGFSNRGFLFGPYCIIYGFGALVLIFMLRGLQQKQIRVGGISITPVLVFLGIVVITTVIELFGSYVMEMLTGSWMWDYTKYDIHFQGRIALNPSLRFGLGGMVFLYVLQPLFEKMTGGMSEKTLNWVSGVVAAVVACDVVYTRFIK